MTNPPPNYIILHIQPCEYMPTTPPQTSSEDSRDLSVLQFQIYHLLRHCIPVENGRSYDFDHPRLTEIITSVKEIETSVLLLGNSDERASRDMSLTLSSLKIPENSHEDIIERISQAARQKQATTTDNTKSVNVNLDIKIGGITTECVYYDQEVADEIARTASEAMQDQTVNSIPASRSCIEALEMVRIGGMDEVKQQCRCSICLMEFQVGLEVTRLPCSHFYHPDCIVKWLETSHMCPLCRHSMPFDS